MPCRCGKSRERYLDLGAHLSRLERAFVAWPVWLQVVGGLAICFGVGFLAGFAWGLITLGVEAVACGTMAEK